ncbi:Hypothetical protein CINCED_3A008094 [Cinara cedri]|uniref:Uncharacterized protein n=1 Tax=Cinara cedri TaxID=506608 RepID=A0A5E4MLX9_9HEMI|nr:Hypothetical protein CINCED_3A008094 [Cinara cedri]
MTMDGPTGGEGEKGRDQEKLQMEDNEHRAAVINNGQLQLDVPKPPARRLSRSTMSLKIEPDLPAKPPKFQFFPSSPIMPMTPIIDSVIPNGFSPQLYQAYTSNKATDFFFKQLDGFKDTIMTTAKSRLSYGERAVFWMYDKIREWSQMWLTHFFLLFIAAGYCAAGALVFQAIEGHTEKNHTEDITKERTELIMQITNLMRKNVRNNESVFLSTAVNLVRDYESSFRNKNSGKAEWNYLNAVYYCGTVFTTIGKSQ